MSDFINEKIESIIKAEGINFTEACTVLQEKAAKSGDDSMILNIHSVKWQKLSLML